VSAGGGSPAARSGREAPRDPCTAVGANGLPHGDPRPTGHVSRQHGGHGFNDGDAAVAVSAEEMAREGRHWQGKAMGLTARAEEAHGSLSACAHDAWHWQPWRLRVPAWSGARREQRSRERVRKEVESSGAQLEDQGHNRETGHVATVHSNGGSAHGAWSPRRQNIGHLVGVGEGEVGAGFGPDLCRFGPWAQNEVCFFPDALHFLFKEPSH